jgi:hypothetical protein
MYLGPLFVFAFFPGTPNPTKDTMNWGIVMYGGITILATTYYMIGGRKTFAPPKDTLEDLLTTEEYDVKVETEAGVTKTVDSDKNLHGITHRVKEGVSNI